MNKLINTDSLPDINFYPKGNRAGHYSVRFSIWSETESMNIDGEVTVEWQIVDSMGDGYWVPQEWTVDYVEVKIDRLCITDCDGNEIPVTEDTKEQIKIELESFYE